MRSAQKDRAVRRVMETRSLPVPLGELRRLGSALNVPNANQLSKRELCRRLDCKDVGRLLRAHRRAVSKGRNVPASKRRRKECRGADDGIRVQEKISSEGHTCRASSAAIARGVSPSIHDTPDGPTRVSASSQRLQAIDPVSLLPLTSETTVFTFTRPGGKKVQYDAVMLSKYIIETGNFTEPETRIPFSDSDLERLDTQVAQRGEPCGSTLDARRQGTGRYARQRFRDDALLGLERIAGEYITTITDLIEQEYSFEGHYRLTTDLLPNFTDLFGQIAAEDPEFAKHSLAHFASFVCGPPNRRTKDKSGLLFVVLNLLSRIRSDLCEEEDGQSSQGILARLQLGAT